MTIYILAEPKLQYLTLFNSYSVRKSKCKAWLPGTWREDHLKMQFLLFKVPNFSAFHSMDSQYPFNRIIYGGNYIEIIYSIVTKTYGICQTIQHNFMINSSNPKNNWLASTILMHCAKLICFADSQYNKFRMKTNLNFQFWYSFWGEGEKRN